MTNVEDNEDNQNKPTSLVESIYTGIKASCCRHLKIVHFLVIEQFLVKNTCNGAVVCKGVEDTCLPSNGSL